MRAVVQRVSRCRVTVEGKTTGEIGSGLLVLLGVGKNDNEAATDYLAEKILGLRIFEDEAGKMNLSVQDKRGEILVVSQLRVFCRKTTRGRAALRNGSLPGHDGRGTGEPGASDDSVGF